MPLPLLLAPLISMLASNGLGLLSSVIETKGKEFIEDKLGVKIPNAENMTPELLQELKIKEMEHEETLQNILIEKSRIELEAEKNAQDNISSRWLADMASDSFLSKNIRPMTLIFILFIYTLFSLLSAFGVDVKENYVELLAQWGMIVMSAYFVGRTVEKLKGVE